MDNYEEVEKVINCATAYLLIPEISRLAGEYLKKSQCDGSEAVNAFKKYKLLLGYFSNAPQGVQKLLMSALTPTD